MGFPSCAFVANPFPGRTVDNAFIYQLEDNRDYRRTPWHFRLRMSFLPAALKFVNRHARIFKVSFSDDTLNRDFGIPASFRFKENMLKGNMTSIEQAINLYHLLSQTIVMDIEGAVVELGCYEGITAILLRKTLDSHGCSKPLHVYDSFQGLPEPATCDGRRFGKGSLRSTRESLVENFRRLDAALPVIHEGWFSQTLAGELPSRISFAHLDGDFHSSIRESLVHVYPRLSRGAVVVVDDYCDPGIHPVNNILPGVKKACDEFLSDKPEKMTVLIAGCESHGFFRRL